MVFPYTFQPIILLRITPAANRNSYRVAMLEGQLPRVAVFARNPGLGKRNSVRVAKGAYHPQWTACIAVMGITVSHYNPGLRKRNSITFPQHIAPRP